MSKHSKWIVIGSLCGTIALAVPFFAIQPLAKYSTALGIPTIRDKAYSTVLGDAKREFKGRGKWVKSKSVTTVFAYRVPKQIADRPMSIGAGHLDMVEKLYLGLLSSPSLDSYAVYMTWDKETSVTGPIKTADRQLTVFCDGKDASSFCFAVDSGSDLIKAGKSPKEGGYIEAFVEPQHDTQADWVSSERPIVYQCDRFDQGKWLGSYFIWEASGWDGKPINLYVYRNRQMTKGYLAVPKATVLEIPGGQE